MLRELTLEGEVDKVKVACARLKLHEPPEGYYVAFRGGKDSCVVLDLCKRAGVKYDAHYSVTTVDPPELVHFIQREYPDAWANRVKPALSMWELIPKKRMPPTQRVRYCCKYFKEGGGAGRFVVTGVRHQESAKRAKRKLMETCTGHSGKRFIHPIIEWSESDVWEYIHTYNVPYCNLYDEGRKRIGCILCPYTPKAQKDADMKRWPKYVELYKLAFQRMIDKRKADGLPCDAWETGEDVMNWWTNRKKKTDDTQEISLFGLRLHESDT